MFARKVGFYLTLFLAACQVVPDNNGPCRLPYYGRFSTPAIGWIGEVMNECTSSQTDYGLIVYERSAPFLDVEESDFVFRWGAPSLISTPAFTIGWDNLTIIVHPDNPLQSINLDELRGIYLGNVNNWGDLDPQTPLSGNIQAWGYSQGEDIQLIFEAQLGGKMNNPAVQLAPDVPAILQAVGSNPNAIGYLPMRWVDDEIKILTIDEQSNSFDIPILALSSEQPRDAKYDWLLCLDNRIKQ